MEKAYRITVFVPPAQLEVVLASISKVLPDNDNKYAEVFWWSSPGTEQFRPLEGSNPTSGSVGELSRLDSVELKFLLPRDSEILNRVIEKGILPAHPWEAPVITVDKCLIALNFPELKESKN
jgi:hypothetical protein